MGGHHARRAAAASYMASAVNFDGANDYLLRGADLTGNADSKTGLLSLWIKMTGSDSANQVVFTTANNRIRLRRLATNLFYVSAQNSAGTTILEMNTANAYTIASGWSHILASWDLAATTGQLYLNDASDKAGSDPTPTNDTIDYTDTNYAIGASSAGSAKTDADYADMYLWLGTYLDLSVTANRRLFIDVDGRPVGRSAAYATLGTPIVALHSGLAAWHTNKGTGGGFSLTGSLTAADGPP
jgi:hypothetical protein